MPPLLSPKPPALRPLLCLAAAVALCALPRLSEAESRVSTEHRWSWSENLGWLDWRGHGDGAFGVRHWGPYLSGHVWAENAGWISLGNLAQAGAGGYTNQASGGSEPDFGVNVAPDGALSGYAYGENIGWLSFNTGAALSPFGLEPRLDVATGVFHGFVWSENTGWISLNSGAQFVALECSPNCAPPDSGGKGCAVNGDLTGDGAASIVDVQCGILTALSTLEGGALPACLTGPAQLSDMDCSGAAEVGDLQLIVSLVLGVPFSSVIDKNANNCHDFCESTKPSDFGK
jgi:hypothetical protein